MKQSRSKTNVPVGTKFKYRNVWLQVITQKLIYCPNCYFYSRRCVGIIVCGSDDRRDCKSVYFKQIPTPNA